MQSLTNIWHAILHDGIFVAQRAQSPVLYPFLLGGIALSVVLGVLNFVGISLTRPKGKRRVGRVLWVEIKFLVRRELLPLYALWLAFATSYDQLPFAAPEANVRWLGFLPALNIYIVLAVLLHGMLAVFGTRIVIAWLTQFHTPDLSRFDVLCIALGFGGIVYGFEIQHWPEWFQVVAEVGLSVVVATLLAGAILGPRSLMKARESAGSAVAGILRLYLGVWIPLWLFTLLVVVLWHQIDLYPVNLAAVFSIAIELDAWYVVARASDDFHRAYLLFVGMLVLTLLAATGVLGPLTHNAGITYNLWIEAGTAAAAYTLVFPLTQLARVATREEIKRQAVITLFGVFSGPSIPLLSSPRGVVEATAERQNDDEGPAPGDNWLVNVLADPEIRGKIGQDVLVKALHQSSAMYVQLRFRAAFVMFLLTLIYHVLAGNPDVLSALGGNLITLLFGALSLFVGLIALVTSKDIEAARDVLVLLLLLTLGVIAADVAFNFTPEANGFIATAPSSLTALFTDRHYLLVTLHSIAQELLVLLSLGQIYYLFIVINASLAKHQSA